MQGYTDIAVSGWVGRLPQGWRPYALLARLDRPIGAWLLFLPGLWAFALVAPSWAEGGRLALLFGIGAVAMRGAGCVVNDLWDRDIDRKVERTRGRPLAAGTVTPLQALAFLAGLCLIGLAVLVQLNRTAILLGLCSLLPILLYPLAKRVTHWPQAMLGLTFSWAAPEGVAAATGQVGPLALILWAAGFTWILGYDTIYAHQDREDDAAVGIGSTALRFGERTRPFLVACYGATLALLALAGWVAGLHWFYLPALALPAALLARQVLTLDIHDPGHCLTLFKANREVGLAVALAFLIGRL
ncbi:4-hydroxybenzoate octaprenyltransferase [Siccirubricoccus sp. KC 17139]|uniref:4-hydroxybenzoate octaprenyltransferase n=1 Tax=Siccirubricoccus soli TaxID=2899147 RepID=A0ABT1D6S2_9PROT|nr:4-hydroxybenzoate octaprenyltransferase [Siccirubricoccus soli]MCO6417574.1 4-hydroxybenzoate octaprenyltransferase [Siccirubricoccus soli]MCP2683709.1 4-hydroxybenzoate octaprenyltransferase [Siccirubricoccus soli]